MIKRIQRRFGSNHAYNLSNINLIFQIKQKFTENNDNSGGPKKV